MQPNPHRGRYRLESYDKYFCLKPPPLLWLAMLYLSRAVSLPVVIGLSSMAGGSANTTALVHGIFGPGTLLSSCIAFSVLCTVVLRSPSAPRAVRWIFTHGRALLIASCVLDALLGLVLAGVSLDSIRNADEHIGGALIGAVLDLYVLIYLLCSKRVRHVFCDFPGADLPAAR
jgi:hypothetical protein